MLVLTLLQELLDSGRTPSTLKLYVAVKAVNCAPMFGQLIRKHNLVVKFLRSARRLNPHRPCSVPSLDLSTKLMALRGPPFEPLKSADLWSLSLNTDLLLALASVKQVRDLEALSVEPSCLEFGSKDSKVVLRLRKGYVLKVPSTLFRTQVIVLLALPLMEDEQVPHPLCPVRALRVYIEHYSWYRQLEQLFVSFAGCTKWLLVLKQKLSR